MIFSIVWDLPDDPDGNVQHIAQNDISVAEVEEVLGNESNPVVVSRSSDRWMTFGWTSTGRYIAVAWDSIETDPIEHQANHCVRRTAAAKQEETKMSIRARSKETPVKRGQSKAVSETTRLAKERQKIMAEFPSDQEIPDDLPHWRMGSVLMFLNFIRSLRVAREAAGLSLTDVARRSGIAKAALSRLETGRQKNPTVDTLIRYADTIGHEIDWQLRPSNSKTTKGSSSRNQGEKR